MNKPKIDKSILFLLAAALLISLSFYTEASSQNFRLLTDAYDGIAGPAQSESFLLRVGAGGPVATDAVSTGTDFCAWSGYVHTAAYEHGDVNADGSVAISDVVYLVNYLFKSGPEPIPLETGDVNGNNEATISDAVYLVNYLFKSGSPPINL